jgi:hypothetical protein
MKEEEGMMKWKKEMKGGGRDEERERRWENKRNTETTIT